MVCIVAYLNHWEKLFDTMKKFLQYGILAYLNNFLVEEPS